MIYLKRLVAFFAGEREKLASINLHQIDSVLIKPIGDAVGDAVAHTAHINQLKQFNPNLHVGVIVTPRNQVIFEQSGLVDILIPDRFYHYLEQRRKWDLYLDFQPSFTTKTILFEKILSPKYIAISPKRTNKFYTPETVKNFNVTLRVSNDSHIADYLTKSQFGQYLDSNAASYCLRVEKNDNLPISFKQDKFSILISPQGSNREIPAEEMAVLINRLDDQVHHECRFILAVPQAGEYYLDCLRAGLKHKVDLMLLPKTTLLEYVQIISECDFIISVDSGTVHLACAINKPLLAFYANHQANLKKWSPKMKNELSRLIIGKQESDSNQTNNFDMDDAAEWFNTQYSLFKK